MAIVVVLLDEVKPRQHGNKEASFNVSIIIIWIQAILVLLNSCRYLMETPTCIH